MSLDTSVVSEHNDFGNTSAIQRDQVYACLVADPRWTQWISPDIPTSQQTLHTPCSTIVTWTPYSAIKCVSQFLANCGSDHNFYKDTCNNSVYKFKFILWDSFNHLDVDLNFYKLKLCHSCLFCSHTFNHNVSLIHIFLNNVNDDTPFQMFRKKPPDPHTWIYANGARRYLYSPLSFCTIFVKEKESVDIPLCKSFNIPHI